MIKWLIFLGILIPVFAVNRFLVRGRNHHYVFAYLTGSALAAILIAFIGTLTQPGIQENAYLLAPGIVAIVLLWKFLFGPWGAQIKAAVLGTFLFWIAIDRLGGQSPENIAAVLLALFAAAVPAAIWCLLFLRKHAKRLPVVLLTFFAGMLSTAPILFYDHVVRSGLELNFFFFRIVPEHFMRSSETFVTQSLTGQLGIVSESAAVTLVSFALVGVIEEWSKNWVVRRSDRAYFSSIDDVMQLSIIAAIGFAFAENVVNPNYFVAFVQDYLVEPAKPEWGAFLGSVFGRSIITNMVHIVSSAVLGYHYGLAFFARPVLEDDRAGGKRHPGIAFLHRLLGFRRTDVFRDGKMITGLLLAIGLHSLFDVLVSLPEVLPGRPDTLSDISPAFGPFGGMSLITLPAFFYVFGGFFLIAYLFRRREGLKEYGYRLREEVFVTEEAVR